MERCVCCGEVIPEGRQVCDRCIASVGTSPCKGCKKREVGCHSSCHNYQMWRTVKDAQRDKLNEIKEYQHQGFEMASERWARRRKKRHK